VIIVKVHGETTAWEWLEHWNTILSSDRVSLEWV